VLAASSRQRVPVLVRSSSDKPGDRRDVSDMTGALDASIVPMLLTVNPQIGVKLYAPPGRTRTTSIGRSIHRLVGRVTRGVPA
jgi:hypothetical protein